MDDEIQIQNVMIKSSSNPNLQSRELDEKLHCTWPYAW